MSFASIGCKMPMKMWIGHASYYNNLRAFKCSAYSYIKQDKLFPRTPKCIFLGYLNGLKG